VIELYGQCPVRDSFVDGNNMGHNELGGWREYKIYGSLQYLDK
jgi:hypothetical protein